MHNGSGETEIPMLETKTLLPIATEKNESEMPDRSEMVWIDGGSYWMGSDQHYPEEAPAHQVRVDGFWIDRTPVTNRDFAKFVEATGYVTFAEIPPDPESYPGALPEMLYAGSSVFVKPAQRGPMNLYNWWQFLKGADWRHPYGAASSLGGMEMHPVVHIAYCDAEAYAQWAGKELPTEAEWEFASRGGMDRAAYAWGEELNPDGQHLANTWQGEFPWNNQRGDGYESTSPTGVFPANGYGLVDMIGNVWEWTSDWYQAKHGADTMKACCVPHNPRGAAEEGSYDPREPDVKIPRKVLKGGSHLCAPNYCQRYRPAARFPQQVDTSTSHIGFRCVNRVKPQDL
jgi:formylglycine-generating enzyme required for sulfatase activity